MLYKKYQLIISMILLGAVGCSKKPSTHYVLPVGFSGVFKIEKVLGHKGGYLTDGSCYIFKVPENGILLVAPDVFDAYTRPCNAKTGPCNEMTATFADDKEITLYSPLASPSDFSSDTQMLLGVFAGRDALWYAVGTHEQLSRFLEQVRREKYQKLERFLPPNQSFQKFR